MGHKCGIILALFCSLPIGVVWLQCDTKFYYILICIVHHATSTALVSVTTAAIDKLLLWKVYLDFVFYCVSCLKVCYCGEGPAGTASALVFDGTWKIFSPVNVIKWRFVELCCLLSKKIILFVRYRFLRCFYIYFRKLMCFRFKIFLSDLVETQVGKLIVRGSECAFLVWVDALYDLIIPYPIHQMEYLYTAVPTLC